MHILSGSLFVMTAPSGTGKTSLARAVVSALEDVVVNVSYTTRAQRSHEQSGQSYHFVDLATFEKMVERGEFIEHSIVYGHHYGASRHWVIQHLQSGRDVVLVIDCQGAFHVKAIFKETTLIFVMPPSKEELKRRLINREQNSISDLDKRLAAASDEVALSADFDYLVINKLFDQAVTDIVSIIRAKRLCYKKQCVHYQALLNKF